ncbi:FAD-dependent monooxygenase (plasmid) [Rhizobium sp. CB3090]|uniref:FAD-dependent monooxygenase n=1 Tax=Rhizobium sp. CB3090 TaxID=3039156 RepID=UPI0024B0D2BF|nr:FAD-dependent monooxygenase [Rhizobium sp. CB3090]WFU11611.1 FAD-dependent monooxygenase [Rhizobium sp. CB3090]
MIQEQVLVVGAGPTGLVLALWLTKMGISVRIISDAPGPGTASRALAVHARTLELYGQMNLADAVVAAGFEVKGVKLWVGGKPEAKISLENAGTGHTCYPFLHIYPQDRHERLLIDRLGQEGVTVEWNTRFVSYREHDAGILATLADPSGKFVETSAAFLAGCDGASSAVRKSLDLDFPGGTYAQTFYVADVEASGPSMTGELHLDLDSSDFLAVFPLDAESGARLIGTVKENPEDAGKLSFEDVDSRAIRDMKIDVKAVHWFSSYRVHHRVVEHFRKGRAFLLGDAAHIHSPAGGQGMNTGIGDAINLAWKLRMVLRGEAEQKLLETYEVERIAFARKLVRTTDQMFTLATAEGRLAAFIRSRIVPLVAPAMFSIDALREWAFLTVSQLSINYRDDPLSEGKVGDVQGGDRLPWIELGNGSSNYDGLKDMRWHLQIYGSGGRDLEAWCDAHSVVLDRFAWHDAFKQVGLEDGATFLVRPDCYIGLAGQHLSAAELGQYFDRKCQFQMPHS